MQVTICERATDYSSACTGGTLCAKIRCMNIDFNSFTEKSAFAMQEAQNLARQNGQQEIDTWHLLIALVQQEGGIVPSLLERMQISPSAVELAAKRELNALPKASGSINASQV